MARPGKAPGYGQVRIHKRGRYYYARFSLKGKRIEVSLRVSNRIRAEEKARAINEALEKGEPWEWALGRQPKGAKVFADLVKEFWEKGCTWGPTTREKNASTVDMLEREFGEDVVGYIDRAKIEGYLARRIDGGLKISSRNRYLCALKVILGKAQDWGYVSRNAASEIKSLPEGRKQPNPLRSDEVEGILDALEGHPRRVAEIYLNTGMRRGELVNLLWKDVDLSQGQIMVREPKNHRDRTIPMSKLVWSIMQELHRERDVNAKAGVIDLHVVGPSANIRKPLIRAAIKANIEVGRRDRLQHRLRDTFITTMVERGVPLDRVQVLAGHNSIEMTRRYAETRSESLREAIQQVFDI